MHTYFLVWSQRNDERIKGQPRPIPFVFCTIMDPNLTSESQASFIIIQLKEFYRIDMEKKFTDQQAKWKAQETALLQKIQQLCAFVALT